MPYERKAFFDGVRKDLFRGNLTQAQVDGMNYLLEVWEQHFERANPRDGTNWLAYCLATFLHETAETMQPIEEYGKGSGKSYGQPAGPHTRNITAAGMCNLTWADNYKNGETIPQGSLWRRRSNIYRRTRTRCCATKPRRSSRMTA